ncbi:MAG: iron permease [Phycisphaera sp.]|nr:iron permease [Phycisphaera sp.]
MPMPALYLLLTYCLLILLASLAGGWVPLLFKLTHRHMQLAVSAVAGFMLGVGMLHLLPHAFEDADDPHTVVLWVLAGVLTMFFAERFFCFHHHDIPDESAEGHDPHHDHTHGHHHGHGHNHDHAHDHPDATGQADHSLTWSGAAVGLTLHSVLAGVALGASFQFEKSIGSAWPGIAVFLVIFLHKPFDSMTLGALMAVGGWSPVWRHVINGLFAMAIPLGVVLFELGAAAAHGHGQSVINPALAFSAGLFLCIALSDLLPELQFHHHDRVKLSLMLVVGLALAWTIAFFEAKTHDHGSHHGHEHTTGHIDTDHIDADHADIP